jgi:diguanylate cyclase (GGDEF)-like protein/PAS domain S-box-containing protein
VSHDPILVIASSAASQSTVDSATAALRGRQYKFSRAYDLTEGLAQVQSGKFSCALLDLDMPERRGLPAFLRFQSQAGTVPIVVLADRGAEELAIEAVRRGALDYLLKEEVTGTLLDKVLRLALERTHTVLALRASEARFRTMFESTAAGVYQASCDDRLISANPAFVSILGYGSEEEVLQLEISTQIAANAEDFAAWRQELDKAGELRSRQVSLLNKRGDRIVALHSARLIRDSRGAPLYYEGTLTDITASHQRASQWSYEASHDSLTGLINRRELERRLHAALENARIDRSSLVALMIDLDDFKRINDNHGHSAGDDLLRHAAMILRSTARGGDLVARLGGDEFCVVLENCSEEVGKRIAEKIVMRLQNEGCLWAGQLLLARASVGLGVGSGNDLAWSTLFERADSACYRAKSAGGNRVEVYCEDSVGALAGGGNCLLAAQLQRTFDAGELDLVAQRIIPIRSPTDSSHFEIGVRLPDTLSKPGIWHVGQLCVDAPTLLRRIDKWALQKSCVWLGKHQAAYPKVARWFLNLTAASFENPELAQVLVATVRTAGVAPSRIGFEIDEQALTAHFPAIYALVQQLTPRGFEFTLDGFGRGISSFANLKSLAVSNVKMDWTEIADGAGDGARDTVLRSLHDINHALGRRTIIQNVDSQEAARYMAMIGVDYAQGLAIAIPVPLTGSRTKKGLPAGSQTA